MTKAIVFYCKKCNGIFFAAVNESSVIRDSASDIAAYIQEGCKMEEVEHEQVREGAWCICVNGDEEKYEDYPQQTEERERATDLKKLEAWNNGRPLLDYAR